MASKGKKGNNRDLMQSPGLKKEKEKEDKLEYGLDKWELKNLKINLEAFDKEYEKF